ncbi:hypothetical protein BG004_005975 [Podila humilis]|nr:hypothetical protein BG004_005975 [Podila humilis]
MDYINSNTVTLGLVGIGMGVYYVYIHIIKPHDKLCRAMLAEKAQNELLIAHERQVANRGSNKHAKKKILQGRPTAKTLEHKKDVDPQEVDNHVFTSNPFELLDAPKTSPLVKSLSKKDLEKVKLITPDAPTPLQVAVEETTDFDDEAQVTQTMPFSPVLSRKSNHKRPTATQLMTTTSIAIVAPTTGTVKDINVQVHAQVSAKADEREVVLKKSGEGVPESGSRNFDVESTSAPEPFKFVQATSPPPSPQPAKTNEISTKVVGNNKLIAARDSKSQHQPTLTTTAEAEPAVAAMEVAALAVLTPSHPEPSVPSRKYEALQALLRARELALVAADAGAERTRSQIQDLQRQLEANAELVKSATRSQNRVQNIEAKIESLNYTNALLVNQLLVEKETSKEAQALMLKATKIRDEAVTVQELETKIRDLEQERMTLTSAHVEQMTKLNQDMLQQRTQSETEVAQLLVRMEESENAAREKNEHHQTLAGLLAEKENRISELEAEIGAMEGELEGLKIQMENHTAAMAHAEDMSHCRDKAHKSEKQGLLDEIDVLREELSRANAAAISSRDNSCNHEHVLKEFEEIRRDLAETQSRQKEMQFKHEELQTMLASKEQEASLANDRAQALAVQLSRLESNELSKSQTHQEEFEHLVKELEESNNQIQSLTEKQVMLTSQIVDLTTKSTEHTNHTQEQTEELQQQIEVLVKQVKAKESSEELVLNEKAEVLKQMEKLQAEHEAVQLERDALVKERQELMTMAESNTRDIELMNQEKNCLALEYSQKYEWSSKLVKEKESLMAATAKRTLEVETLSKEKSELAAEKVLLVAQLTTALEGKKLVDEELEILIEANNIKTSELEEEHGAMSAKVVELEMELEKEKKKYTLLSSSSVMKDVVHEEETTIVITAMAREQEVSMKDKDDDGHE